MATAAQVAEYRAANAGLVMLAQRELTGFWETLPLSGDPGLVRAAVLEFFPNLVTTYGRTAAVLGADWYDLLRDVPASAASFYPLIAATPTVAQSQGSARWALGPLFDDAPATSLEQLSGALQRLVLQAGRDTVFRAAQRDPVRTMVARVPRGVNTCDFCVMVASRGAVYHSARSAGGEDNRYHDNCYCVPTVIRSGSDWPEGHDVDTFTKIYRTGLRPGDEGWNEAR